MKDRISTIGFYSAGLAGALMLGMILHVETGVGDTPPQADSLLVFTDVSDEDLRAAMEAQLREGYDLTATTNAGRFQVYVVLYLARKALADVPNGPPLHIKYDNWSKIWLELNGLSEENAPLFARLAFEHRQDLFIDYSPGSVIKEIKDGGTPELALNVQASWPDDSDLPEKYTFVDTLSTPTLKVTNHRIIRYRLIDYGDMVLLDEIRGVTGRPTSGFLGALFKLIGDGRVVWTRISISEDGLQLTRARAKKGWFSVTETISIQPDGRAQKGLSEKTDELVAMEIRLKREIKISYHDWPL